ncbi:tetratricopeptide repeat protein [Marinobacter sp. ELB17]|uniref:tetratricopeptide repeat protein n=1 Tax=Marinobacter sp. ELB17 TaxID=270374 RepID=UPI0000F39656|nr:tetratricopeptide repeat protein [Marinobacter sp. ELB17]EAZ97559.1 Sel1-like repeat [Marinobacter sp. ELB17]
MRLFIRVVCFFAIFFIPPVQASDLQRCKAQNLDSFKACERLASGNNPDGQFGLGLLFLEGNGVKEDYQKSFELMHKASMQGHAAAQFQVGQAHVNGQGVKQNFEEAYAWFLVSKENGNSIASRGIDFMESKNLIKKSKMNAITQRANDIYASTSNKKGFQYDDTESSQNVSSLAEYCDMVMPTVDSVITYKKYGKPQSEARQLMIGMTDKEAIKMMNGVINWVWSTNVPVSEMSRYFKNKCLGQSKEISFMFP